MKSKKNLTRKSNQKAQKPSRPFEGLIKQLERETVVLVHLDKFDAFKQALKDNDIDYDLGDFYGEKIIVVKK